MKRRFISGVMAAVMIIGLLPATGIDVWAASAFSWAANDMVSATASGVTYKRFVPEVSLLNANNGGNDKFYEKLKGRDKGEAGTGSEATYPSYNGVKELYGGTWNWAPTYNSDEQVTDSLNWAPTSTKAKGRAFKDSVIKRIGSVSGNLSFKVSADFQNYKHNHKDAKKTVTSFVKVSANMAGRETYTIRGLDNDYGGNRVGDGGSYARVNVMNDDGGNINFTRHEIKYDANKNKWCRCRGASANHTLLTFCDDRGPQLSKVSYKVNKAGSNKEGSWNERYAKTHSLNTEVGAGDELFIKLSYDEPIRFADDDVNDKNKYYVTLKPSGDNGNKGINAYLYMLDGYDVYFKCTIPENTEMDDDIATIDTASLFATDTKLVHIDNEGGNFSITNPKNDGDIGYSKAECIITDLAGNSPVSGAIIDPKLSIDTMGPMVEKIEFDLGLGNGEVKNAYLEMNPGKDISQKETDESDLYLGVGDTMTIYVNMSEALNMSLDKTQEGYTILKWEKARALTNIKRADGSYVEATSFYFRPYEPNKYNLSKTSFMMKCVGIEDGMYVEKTADNPSGEVRVTKFYFVDYDEPIKDMSGNLIQRNKDDSIKIATGANSNPPFLDTKGPIVSGSNYTDETNGFRYTLDIDKGAAPTQSDFSGNKFNSSGYYDSGDKKVYRNEGATNIADTYGYFTLTHKGDENAYSYYWVISSEPNGSKITDEKWTKGVMGVEQRFIQSESQYLHVKADKDAQYETLDKCTLKVRSKDFAGTEGSLTTEPGEIKWYVDNVPPTAMVQEVQRSLNGDTGTITAKVKLEDTHGIWAWQYAWTDSQDTPPQDSDWIDGAVSGSQNSVTVDAVSTVKKGDVLAKHLWVKAQDDSKVKNVSASIYLGRHTYDLTKASYSLKYTDKIQKKADLKVTDLADGDVLYFLIDKTDTTQETDYCVLRVDSSNFNAETSIFDMNGWVDYTVIDQGNGVFKMNRHGGSSAGDYLDGIYTGNINIKVISGKEAGVTESGDLGGEGYEFSDRDNIKLRTTGDNTWENYCEDYYDSKPTDCITMSTYECLTNKSTEAKVDPENPVLKTFAGLNFYIKVHKDRFGWNCEDLDCGASKLVFTNNTTGEVFEKPISKFVKNEAGEYMQTFSVNGDFTTGIYSIKLKLASVVGETYDIPYKIENIGRIDGFVIDATEANPEALKLSSIIYDEYSIQNMKDHGLKEVYEERENVIPSQDVITLPVAGGFFEPNNTPAFSSSGMYKLTFRSEGEPNRGELSDDSGFKSYYGQYYIEAWNEKYSDKKVKFYSTGEEQVKVENDIFTGFSVRDVEKENPNYVYLDRDVENTVFYRKVYANGETSATYSSKIMPVTNYLKGDISIDKAKKEFVFTPTVEKELSIGAKVYALAYQEGQKYEFGEGEYIPMNFGTDGTWRCPLKNNGAIYKVVTINPYGSLWMCDEKDYVVQTAPKSSGITYADNGDGTYDISLTVYDDYKTMGPEGLKLNLTFNDEYSKEGLDFTISDEMFKKDNTYVWRASDISDTGIYNVKFKKIEMAPYIYSLYGYDELDIEISGVVKRQDADVQTERTMNIGITATDDYGNVLNLSTGDKTVKYVQPRAIENKIDGTEFCINFNQPVLPQENWAWHKSGDVGDDRGYKKSWKAAFPILKNGTYEINYFDIFGNLCTEEITTDVFVIDGYDWGIDLKFSETEMTKEAVYVTAWLSGTEAPRKERTGLIITDNTGSGITPEGNYNGTFERDTIYGYYDPNKPWHKLMWQATSTPRKVKVENNTFIEVRACDTERIWDVYWDTKVKQKIYIDNIANEAPEAELTYYVSGLGQQFTKAGLEDYVARMGGSVTFEGNISVKYTTSRQVTPINNTGTEFTFTKSNVGDKYTFEYQDEMENNGSVEVSLPAGITLIDPIVPFIDDMPPSVSVAVATKSNGKYTTEESFLAEEDEQLIKEKFESLGRVQGYSLTVNATDDSGYDIRIRNKGEGIPEGISLNGNIVLVDKAVDFVIEVVDKSEYQNTTYINITKDLTDRIDNTPPTAKIDTVAMNMYEKKIIIELFDKDNAGRDTTVDESGKSLDNITLTYPEGAVKIGTNKYEYMASDNGKIDFVFYDEAGNRNKSEGSSANISGIDTTPPNLTLVWSPPLVLTDENDNIITDTGSHTWEPVNTDVTALIYSDKAISDLEVQFDYFGDTVELLKLGLPTADNPYKIQGQNGTLVTIEATPERIVVTYNENCSKNLEFKATAPNGRTATKEVRMMDIIDKVAPEVKTTEEKVYRKDGADQDYPESYGVKVTFEPDEPSTSHNYGEIVTEPGGKYGEMVEVNKRYDEWDPLVVTFTENGSYRVYFADGAGNVTVVPVKIEGIDTKAPDIKFGEKVETGHKTTVEVTTDEDCTVTIGTKTYNFVKDTPQTIAFTDNGTYSVVAADATGNKSERAISVGNIDKILPNISFTSNTVYILQDSEAIELSAELGKGYDISDDRTAAEELNVDIDTSEVKLDVEGTYNVRYSVTDKAGNTNEAIRFVQVIGKNTVCIRVDGKLILPESTAYVKAGEHQMTLMNSDQPYKVKARKGIKSAGQMKYLNSSSLRFDKDGKFDVSGSGHYTVLVTTQDRKTIRILLHVEQ